MLLQGASLFLLVPKIVGDLYKYGLHLVFYESRYSLSRIHRGRGWMSNSVFQKG